MRDMSLRGTKNVSLIGTDNYIYIYINVLMSLSQSVC